MLHGFRGSSAAPARLAPELHSRELLVVWAALCMVHAATAAVHPLVLKYDVVVQYDDLWVCVLSDRQATDALRAVAAYVRRHSQRGQPAFR